MGRPASDKRDRLVAAAIERFHHQGYANTSLAEVAKSAGVPAGNVFYYFKAKNDLAKAVVDEWCRRLEGYLGELEADGDGWRKLERFIEQASVLRDIYVSLGCPLAGLSQDLRREGDALTDEVPRIYAVQYRWLSAQFAGLGFPLAEAEQHARFLMAGYHGAIMLAYTQNDDTLITSGTASLKAWLLAQRQSGWLAYCLT